MDIEPPNTGSKEDYKLRIQREMEGDRVAREESLNESSPLRKFPGGLEVAFEAVMTGVQRQEDNLLMSVNAVENALPSSEAAHAADSNEWEKAGYSGPAEFATKMSDELRCMKETLYGFMAEVRGFFAGTQQHKQPQPYQAAVMSNIKPATQQKVGPTPHSSETRATDVYQEKSTVLISQLPYDPSETVEQQSVRIKRQIVNALGVFVDEDIIRVTPASNVRKRRVAGSQHRIRTCTWRIECEEPDDVTEIHKARNKIKRAVGGQVTYDLTEEEWELRHSRAPYFEQLKSRADTWVQFRGTDIFYNNTFKLDLSLKLEDGRHPLLFRGKWVRFTQYENLQPANTAQPSHTANHMRPVAGMPNASSSSTTAKSVPAPVSGTGTHPASHVRPVDLVSNPSNGSSSGTREKTASSTEKVGGDTQGDGAPPLGTSEKGANTLKTRSKPRAGT